MLGLSKSNSTTGLVEQSTNAKSHAQSLSSDVCGITQNVPLPSLTVSGCTLSTLPETKDECKCVIHLTKGVTVYYSGYEQISTQTLASSQRTQNTKGYPTSNKYSNETPPPALYILINRAGYLSPSKYGNNFFF